MFWFSVKNVSWNVFDSKQNWARYHHKCTYRYIGLHVKCCYCQVSMQLELPRQILKKYSNIKFNERPSSGGRQTDIMAAQLFRGQRDRQTWWRPNCSPDRRDRQTDMKLTDSFRKSANAPKDKNLSKQDSRIKNKSSGHSNVDDNK